MRVLGIDYGGRSMGIAVSDPLLITAQGLTVLRRRSLPEDLEELDKIRAEYDIEEVVLGLPRMMDGSVGPMGREAQNFARRLQDRWQIPVHLWDERLSTVAAEKALLEGDLSRKKRKNLIDRTAAVLILQSFLERKKQRKGVRCRMENNGFNPEEQNGGFIDFDEETGRVVLRESDGTESGFFVEFELELEGHHYIILVPDEEIEEDTEADYYEEEGIVFRVEEEAGQTIWVAVDDEDELAKIEDALNALDEEEGND